MKPLSTYISESSTSDKKSISSSVSYLSPKGLWDRYCNQIIEELKLPKSNKDKPWENLSKDEQKKVADYHKSVKS